MLYVKTITVPANTPKDQAVKVEVTIEERVLFFIQVRFFPGPMNLLKVAVFYGELQIWPHRDFEWAQGDDEVVWDMPLLEFKRAPYTLTIRGYNEDDTYDHSAIIRIIALERIYIRWIHILARFTRLFSRLIGL